MFRNPIAQLGVRKFFVSSWRFDFVKFLAGSLVESCVRAVFAAVLGIFGKVTMDDRNQLALWTRYGSDLHDTPPPCKLWLEPSLELMFVMVTT
jgi:hypothetical protein